MSAASLINPPPPPAPEVNSRFFLPTRLIKTACVENVSTGKLPAHISSSIGDLHDGVL